MSAAQGDAGLAGAVARGAGWSAAGSLLLRVGNVATTAVAARLLAPSDFGVFAIALAVYLVVSSLAELGLGSAIARSQVDPAEVAPTVTTVSIAVSAVLAALMALTAGPLATLLGAPGATGPIRVLALCLFLTGVFAVPGALLTRDFLQGRILLANLAGLVVGTTLLVVLARSGRGAEAFAWSRVAGQVVAGAVMVAALPRLHLPGLRRGVVGPLLRFGLPLAGANLVTWSLLNADYLIVGRYLSEARVGVYMIAFSVASWSTAVLGAVLNGVVVPAFARVLGDRERSERALASAARLVGVVALPMAAVTAVLAGPLVGTVFGTRWLGAAPVLSVLAVYGAAFAFTLLLSNLLVAAGRTARLLAIQVVWLALLVPTMGWLVTHVGLVGVAWAHVLVLVLVIGPLYAHAVVRTTGLRLTPALRALVRPGLAAAAAGLAAWLVTLVVSAPVGQLLLGGSVAVLVHLALLHDVLRAQVRAVRSTRPVAREVVVGAPV